MTTAQKPKFFQRGFTLVELMIAIAIIAILATVGFTVFSNIQARARNATRQGDIDAIANALETNKTNAGYQVLDTTQFANGVITTVDPQGLAYCVITDTTAIPASTTLTAESTATTCAPNGFTIPSGTNPPADTQFWKVCAWLEAAGGTAGPYCRSNRQS